MNLRNIRLIRFPDGNYAVRRGWIFHQCADLITNSLWWSYEDVHFKDCVSTDYQKVSMVYRIVRGGVDIIL